MGLPQPERCPRAPGTSIHRISMVPRASFNSASVQSQRSPSLFFHSFITYGQGKIGQHCNPLALTVPPLCEFCGRNKLSRGSHLDDCPLLRGDKKIISSLGIALDAGRVEAVQTGAVQGRKRNA